jgi:hypothetical protein
MVLIVAGLLTAGIVAFEKRQNQRDARKRNNSNDQQQQPLTGTSSYEAYTHHLTMTGQRDGYSKVTQAQIDEQAFQEVQNYADFQRSLSKRVHDDILKEGSASNPGYPGSSLSHVDPFRDYLSKEPYQLYSSRHLKVTFLLQLSFLNEYMRIQKGVGLKPMRHPFRNLALIKMNSLTLLILSMKQLE